MTASKVAKRTTHHDENKFALLEKRLTRSRDADGPPSESTRLFTRSPAQFDHNPEQQQLVSDSEGEGAEENSTFEITASKKRRLTELPLTSQLDTSARDRSQEELRKELLLAREKIHKQTADLIRASEEKAQQKRQLEQSQEQVVKLKETLSMHRDNSQKQEKELCMALQLAIRGNAMCERELRRHKLCSQAERLGRFQASYGALGMHEVWQDGQVLEDLAARAAELQLKQDRITAAIKEAPGGKNGHALDLVAQQDCAARLHALTRDKAHLAQESERLKEERDNYIREFQLHQQEGCARFKPADMLNSRYVVQALLGKGGFGEVYQAFDVKGLREVAIKVHQLNESWSNAKKAGYVKHATREFEIHKRLCHPGIVQLLDFFELDSNSFGTVLELCTGKDLDSYLRQRGVLLEEEAKSIIRQIFCALLYMNSDGRKIIHYDLKPANILFDSLGRAKITDFGLSKIADGTETRVGMELTSQGAGTYWYLPPECFVVGPAPPTISSKVDVWSAGVIMFQMLFGRRPFGEGLSQECIMREDVILNARNISFGESPAVSQGCKSFISGCLAYSQKDRLDVRLAAQHPYLTSELPSRED